jgi:hypothetical protein
VSFANDSTDLSGFYGFLYASYNFFGGGANAFSSNLLLGAGRYNSNEPGYRLGQMFGDLASIPVGLNEALSGGELEVLGVALDLTGEGAIVGIPLNALGGAMAIHGGAVSGLGAVHFMEGVKGGGGARNPAQDTRISKGEVEKLKSAGLDLHALKGGKNASRYDIFKDRQGNLYVKPKNGTGPGDPLGININSLR